MKLGVEPLIPVRKGRPVTFELPPVETPSDITKALGTVAKGMAEGELTPDEATCTRTEGHALIALPTHPSGQEYQSLEPPLTWMIVPVCPTPEAGSNTWSRCLSSHLHPLCRRGSYA
jgi:hypothetical protein